MRGVLVVLLAVLLVGCSGPDTANQAHTESSPATVAPPTTTTTTLSLPPRPREIKLDSVAPCSVLSADQRKQLSLDTTPAPYTDTELKAKACTIRGTYSGTVARVALKTDESVQLWISEEAQVEVKAATIVGFPGLVVRTPGLTTLCNVEVDVAEGQFLDVLFRDGGGATPIPQDDLCLGAQRVAEAAVTTLSARR